MSVLQGKQTDQLDPDYGKSLLRKITRHFDEERLRTLCFSLGIEFDDLGGKGKTGHVRVLIEYCLQHGQFDDLVDALEEESPKVYWRGKGRGTGVAVVKSRENEKLKQQFEEADAAEDLRTVTELGNKLLSFNQATQDVVNKTATAYALKGGLSMVEEGKPGRAVMELTRAIELNPSIGKDVIYFSRGVAYLVHGKTDLAVSDLDYAIDSAPEDASISDCYLFRGFAYFKQDDKKKAVKDWQVALETSSNGENDNLRTILDLLRWLPMFIAKPVVRSLFEKAFPVTAA